MFQWGSYWPYVEYLDLYRKAWELNKILPKDAPKFRIIGLDYRAQWNLLKENMPSRDWKYILFKGPRNKHMAEVIQREFIKKHRKALIYVGQYHAFTRYHVRRMLGGSSFYYRGKFEGSDCIPAESIDQEKNQNTC